MSPSDDLPEGPVTTDYFLEDKPEHVAAPQAAADTPDTTIDTSFEGVTEREFNEQGHLTARQRSQLLRGVLLQIPLYFGLALVVFLGRGEQSIGGSSAVIIAVILGLGIVLVRNFTQLIDLWRGKVSRVQGYWSTRTEGSWWLKNRRTVHSIGYTDVRWNSLMQIDNLFKAVFYEGTHYITYYLPISHIIVSYSATSRSSQQDQESQVGGNSRNAVIDRWVLWGLFALGVTFLALIVAATSSNRSYSPTAPVSYSDGMRTLDRVIGGAPSIPTLTVVPVGLRRTLSGHTDIVLSAAFAPDGKTVLTGSFDRTANSWDETSGEKLHTFSGHTGVVRSVAFAPDGKTILTGSDDKTAILWDVASGQKLTSFSGHTGYVLSVAFAPDGKTILTGSDDKTAILWDVASGQKLHTFSGHTAYVSSVAFSLDGKTILTGSADQTAILWDVASEQPLHTFSGHMDNVTSVAFSPDGKTILTGSADRTAILWDVASGNVRRIFGVNTGGVTSVAFAPDGKTILTGSTDQTAKLWDISDLVGETHNTTQ